MRVTDLDPDRAMDATQGRSSTKLAGAQGMVWRDPTTESVGQIRDMTVQGLTFVDNEDGTGILSIGDPGDSGEITGDTVGIIYIIGGAGTVITTGIKGDLQIPFNCAITGWSILLDQSGSIVVDVWKDVYANYPPVVGDSITASAKPTVTTATKNASTALTGWTTAVAAGDTLRFNVDSITTATRATVMLIATRTG